MRKFSWTKKRSIITIVLITILTSTSIGLWQMNNNVQAAIVSPNPPSGCVGLWHFDEGTETVATDSSGNGNSGILLSSPSWVAGKYNEALQFSTASQSVHVPGFTQTTFSSLTISFWVNVISFDSGYSGEFVIGGNSNPRAGVAIYNNDLYGFFRDSSGNEYNVPYLVNQNTWYYVTLVWIGSSSTMYYYINGSLIGQINTGSTTSITFANTVDFHYNFGGTGNSIIDESQIYNRVLSSTEIQANFQNSPGFASQLTAKIPKGTTQAIVTLSWQGQGSINATITSPSQTYTEDAIPVYQKTTYSTTSNTLEMLNIKRLSISVTALPADQSWAIALAFDSVSAYQIAVEVQK
jgi:hypothetical protein